MNCVFRILKLGKSLVSFSIGNDKIWSRAWIKYLFIKIFNFNFFNDLSVFLFLVFSAVRIIYTLKNRGLVERYVVQ